MNRQTKLVLLSEVALVAGILLIIVATNQIHALSCLFGFVIPQCPSSSLPNVEDVAGFYLILISAILLGISLAIELPSKVNKETTE